MCIGALFLDLLHSSSQFTEVRVCDARVCVHRDFERVCSGALLLDLLHACSQFTQRRAHAWFRVCVNLGAWRTHARTNAQCRLTIIKVGARPSRSLAHAQSIPPPSARSHLDYTRPDHTPRAHTYTRQAEIEDVIKIGKLNLVDLAGSENISRWEVHTELMKAAPFALADCRHRLATA